MIRQLIKRDPAWQVVPFLALLITGLALLEPRQSGGVSIVIPFMMSIGIPGFRQRCTLFQATLPIAGRELFLSRIASLMACTWLPLLAAMAITAALRRDQTWADRLPLLETGAAITVTILLIQCFRPRTINPPPWLIVVAYVGMFSAIFMLSEFVLAPPAAAGTRVLGGCALVSATLFWRAWAVVPKSFQLAPAEPVSARSGETKHARPTVVWWPVLRSLYGWQAGVSLFAIFMTMFAGSFLFALITVPAFFITCRLGLRWLLHLPISLRKLFWVMWLPITATLIAGMTVSSGTELTRRLYVMPKMRMIGFAVILLSWMIQICALQLYGWKRLRNIPSTVRIMLAGAPSFMAYVPFIAQAFLLAFKAPHVRDPIFDALVVNLAAVLPHNLWMIGLMAALPLAGLYWLAEKLFREMEFGQMEIHTYRTLGS